jgi:hypothetical protein
MMPGVSPISIGVTAKTLALLHKQPHPEALSWRFGQSIKRRWKWRKQAGWAPPRGIARFWTPHCALSNKN